MTSNRSIEVGILSMISDDERGTFSEFNVVMVVVVVIGKVGDDLLLLEMADIGVCLDDEDEDDFDIGIDDECCLE